MRRFFMTIWTAGCLFLATGGLGAQEPAGKGEPIPPPKGAVESHCPPACVETYKACVAVPNPKTKVVFGCREVDFCVPKCSCSLFSRHHCTDSCPSCEPCARTKRVLLTKVVDDCPGTKCVVEERVRESCPTSHHGILSGLRGGHGCSAPALVLPAEPAPAPTTPPAQLPKGK